MKKSIFILFAGIGFNAAIAQSNPGNYGNPSNNGQNPGVIPTTPTQTMTPEQSDTATYHSERQKVQRNASRKYNSIDTNSTGSKNSSKPRVNKVTTKSNRSADTTGVPSHK